MCHPHPFQKKRTQVLKLVSSSRTFMLKRLQVFRINIFASIVNVEKNQISVLSHIWFLPGCTSTANAILQRRPSIMTPPGVRSETQLVKGEDLNLECIAEGLWAIMFLKFLVFSNTIFITYRKISSSSIKIILFLVRLLRSSGWKWVSVFPQKQR